MRALSILDIFYLYVTDSENLTICSLPVKNQIRMNFNIHLLISLYLTFVVKVDKRTKAIMPYILLLYIKLTAPINYAFLNDTLPLNKQFS